MKPVAILGSGPAGLLAAHTVGMLGKPIAIFSRPEKSHISGAQFMHKGIPGLSDKEPDAVLTYRLEGSEEGYREKVYGKTSGPLAPSFVSFENRYDGKTQDAWNMIKIYDHLWENFGSGINVVDINAEWIEKHLNDFSRIICSIPIAAICKTGSHVFTKQTIKLIDKELIQMDDNTIWYSGRSDRSWYRSSKIFGFGGTEWSDVSCPNPPMPNLLTGFKPIGNNCDCWPEVTRVGRFGLWKKGILAHHAIKQTWDSFQ